eukprot:665138-Pelagomonas_calceolata.AAC.1
MGIWRVVSHAPGCPDSSSPALHHHTPSNPPPSRPLETRSISGVYDSRHLVVIIRVSRAAGFKPDFSAGMLGRCSFQNGKRVDIRAEFQFDKMDHPYDIPALRSDLKVYKDKAFSQEV